MPLTATAVLGGGAFAAVLVAGASAAVVDAAAGATAALFAVVSLFTAAGRLRPSRRGRAPAWRRIGTGALVWLVGAATRPVADNAGFVVNFADILVMVGAVLLAWGCGMTVTCPRDMRTASRQFTDAYVTAASLFLMSWVVVLAPIYERVGDPSTFALALAPPMSCLLAACLVVPPLAVGRSSSWPVSLAGLAVLMVITAVETANAVARLEGDGTSIAGLWAAAAAFLLLAAAPWSGRSVRRAGGAVASSLVAALPLVLVLAATAVMLVHFLSTPPRPPAPVVVIVSASVVTVLAVRLFALLTGTTRLRRQVSAADRRLRELAESTGDVVLICDHDGIVQEISSGAEATYGYRPDTLTGRAITDFIHPEDQPGIQAALRALNDEDPGEPDTCMIACRVRAADGTWRPTESVATRHVRGEELLLVTIRDVSDQEALRNQVAHLTFHDGVTGLPNRAYFEERTREVLAARGSGCTAVVFLDLDGFTAVNDSVGHASGDYLLGQAARRLRSGLRGDDTLARWGGDEFAVLMENGTEAQAVVDLAERLVVAVSAEPFHVADRDVVLTASVGVAFSEDGMPAGDLIRNADVAMAKAKEQGGRRVEVFAAHMHTDVVRRLELAADLQRALTEGQFAIEYQPIVDIATSRVTAVEALVRWWRGSTFVPPEHFLGPAEDTGLIVPLSEWILRQACREVAAWRASSWDIGLSLNLSARQINAPRFVETVKSALEESGLPPSALTLEVIEEMLVEDAEDTIAKLSGLRALGVRLAIDDFGTGYASLALLRQLPVDMIKVDPSFVSGLGHDEALTLLTRTIVRLGHDLGLIAVAEGIERPEQLELLKEMGCTKGQGYLVARPMAAPGVAALMRTNLSGLSGAELAGVPSARRLGG